MFNKKKRFFKEKLLQIERSIWNMEFKISESRKVREGIRLDRDRAVETQGILKGKLETKEANITPELKEKYEKELEKVKDNQTRFEKQMQMLDDELNGRAGTETTDGIEGVTNQIASLVSLRDMTKQYIKKL